MLSKSGKQKNSFHPREAFSDTAARTASKWKVGKLWPGFASLRCPALRIEKLGVRKITRVVMHDVLAHQHERLSGHEVSGNLTILQVHSSNSPCRRIESHRFSEHHLYIFQMR